MWQIINQERENTNIIFIQFFIKGVDYQPGGSSGVNKHADPLSDPAKCARDIYLFQDLGINTIRVYSVNPDLNHDKCLTLLATAGIYLVLDVNSPLEGQHLNRYEPWTTYNENYMNHVFKVVNEFSTYNNTLAFFAGNEIINDKQSALNSPTYVKAVIRDMKHFMKIHSGRQIPIGYSAADDLAYRISLAEYFECYEGDPSETVDFYGVNTYQWCGEQTFQSSGYNVLVKDYASFTKPIFFSEYGCNEITPRRFNEVPAIYSSQMTHVFSGGLVYEFAQEPNNYGLVDYDEWGNIKLLPDYYSFRDQMNKVKEVETPKKLLFRNQGKTDSRRLRRGSDREQRKLCESEYLNLDISKGVPRSICKNMVKTFKVEERGKYVPLSSDEMSSHYQIFGVNGEIVQMKPTVKAVPEQIAEKVKYVNSCKWFDIIIP